MSRSQRSDAGRVEHHAHRLPGVRDRVTEGVDARRSRRARTPGAQRRRRPTCRARPRPVPGRSTPTPSAAACWSPGARDLACDSLEGGSHSRGISSASQHLVAPAPVGDVEEQRAGRVRHVDRPLAGEPQAHVVLREHDPPDPLVDVGLVPSQPQQLRRREAGQRTVARQRDQPLEPDALLDLGALRARCAGRSRGSPGGGRDRPRRGNEPVHLAREPDAGCLAPTPSASARLARAPPVLGILLGPAGLRRRQGIVAPRPRRAPRRPA